MEDYLLRKQIQLQYRCQQLRAEIPLPEVRDWLDELAQRGQAVSQQAAELAMLMQNLCQQVDQLENRLIACINLSDFAALLTHLQAWQQQLERLEIAMQTEAGRFLNSYAPPDL